MRRWRWQRPKLVIGPATVEDARAIADIRVAGWRTAYAGLIKQQVVDTLDPVAEAERRRRDWATQPLTAAVATFGGPVVGFMMTGAYRDDGDRADWPVDPCAGEVAALYVDPTCHGRGIGRALLSRALSGLRSDGCTVARLWVLTGNSRARRFYTAAGFTDESTAGVVKEYTARGGTRATSEIRYSRTLADTAGTPHLTAGQRAAAGGASTGFSSPSASARRTASRRSWRSSLVDRAHHLPRSAAARSRPPPHAPRPKPQAPSGHRTCAERHPGHNRIAPGQRLHRGASPPSGRRKRDSWRTDSAADTVGTAGTGPVLVDLGSRPD